MAPVIRVNLIPFRQIRRAGRQRIHCFWGAAAVALTVITLVALTWREWETESELTTHLETLRRTITTGRSNTTTVERLKKHLDTHREILSTLEEIRHPGTTHDDVLRRVAKATPNPLWLTRLTLKDDTLILEGRATDHAMIARFLRELKADSRFADNQLVEVHQPKEGSKHGNKRFSVKSRIVNHTAKNQKDRATPK